MNLPKLVAKARMSFHANMLDVCNVANQLGILTGEQAEKTMKNHTMQFFEAFERVYPERYKRVFTEES